MSSITESVADTLSLSDSLLDAWGFGSFDSLSLSDSEKLILGLTVNNRLLPGSTSEGLALSDSVHVSLFVASLGVIGSLTLSDRVASFAPYVTAVSDSLSLSDSVGIGQLAIFDSLSLSDAVALGQAMSVLDGLGLSDAAVATLVNNFLALTELAADSFSLFDSTQHSAFPIGQHLSDGLVLVDLSQAALFSNPVPYLRRYLNDVVPN